MNACRKYLKLNDLTGKVFLTSGLGGMSGAQAKASVIAGCIGVIAEVSVALFAMLYVMFINVFSLLSIAGQQRCSDEKVRSGLVDGVDG